VNLGQRAVIWRPDGSVIDLNDLGVVANPPDGTWLLTNATAISADGWVAGYGAFTPTGGLPYGRGWVAHITLPAMLPGDYNGNDVVDAADYTVWRDHLGQSFTLLNRDPSASGPIGGADYDFWVTHFGNVGGGAGAAAAKTLAEPVAPVPEPSTMLLMLVAVMGCVGRLARWRAR
jgi:hypothetical protein